MSFLSALFYDQCMKSTEDACLIEWRKNLLRSVSGKVLEIGAGTGASLELYPREAEIELHLTEPDRNMRLKLEKKARESKLNHINVLAFPAESLECDDNQYDYVFASLVCCSVENVEATLAEIKRVLKPEGRFIFLEHVAAEQGTKRRKWQNRLNVLWRKLAGNCHLNRETEKSISNAGFQIQEIHYESMRKAMPLVRPTIRGIATKG